MILGICLCWAPFSYAEPSKEKFAHWMVEFRTEASAAGISQQTLERALAGIEDPLAEVIVLDREQPEFTQTVEEYVSIRVNDQRIADGRRMLRRYPTWLGRIEGRHGVQRRFIVALWGIETNYGKYTGGFSVLEALVSLAYDGRRSDYFRRELLEALRIVDAGHIPLKRMKGSWAGAMGQCQFMPSVFARYAIDAEGDGRIDIWNSVPDVLASAANYLSGAGWKDDQTWGRPVRLPKEFDTSLLGLERHLPLSKWQALGVRRTDGRTLPRRELDASLIRPDGPGGQAYLVYDNFRVLRVWNKSNAFALAVGLLSDRVAGRR
ncbi:MAG: lytic transglycosylase [Desulfuromonadales bacterium C00003107]|nr:MAG: lytic transglycosylase [Desulfuromonadales bacterium C00003107]